MASDVDRALGDRKLIITWLNRGTLHLVRAEDYPMLQAVTTPPLWTSCRTRLRQTGVGEAEAERGLATIAKALADEGPLTRAQLRDRLDSADVPTAGQAFIHVLFYAALHGVCVRGPMVDKEHAFVAARDRTGPQREIVPAAGVGGERVPEVGPLDQVTRGRMPDRGRGVPQRRIAQGPRSAQEE